MAGVSSPLGGPGAARVAVWPGLLDFPWAIPFRVGSERERRKDISPEYSLEGLMLKLKLQYCGHLM